MLYKISDYQFISFAGQLERAYKQITMIKQYDALIPSFYILRRQATTEERKAIVSDLLNLRYETLCKLKA